MDTFLGHIDAYRQVNSESSPSLSTEFPRYFLTTSKMND